MKATLAPLSHQNRLVRKAVMAAHTTLTTLDPGERTWAEGALAAYTEVGCQFFHMAPTARVLRDAVLGAVSVAGPVPAMAARRIWLDDVVEDILRRVEAMTTEMSELTKEEQ